MKQQTQSELTIAQQIELAQKQLKELKLLAKPVKQPKQLKGVKVKFQTKSGETVEGLGVLYYVARMNGKLYYKEASAVELIQD